MQLINYSSNKFEVAAERTEGIPEHAIEIQGDLIEVDASNLNGWGVKSSAVDEIIENGIGIPVRMCNNPDPHECDYNTDHWADIGYVTKMWLENGWIKARSAITDKTAVTKIEDGTWMPFNKGDWSVSGYPGNDFDDDFLMYKYTPASISFIMPPNKPAYEGSKFELVAAAVKNNKLQSELNKENQTGDNMTDGKENGANGDPKNEEEPGKANDIKPGDKTKVESKTEPEAKPAVEPNDKKDNPVMYSQEDYDKKLAESLETQKTEYEEQIALMTQNSDLESMLSAAKKETIKETLDEINRGKLASEVMKMVSASKVLSAPLMVDGRLDESKIKIRTQEIKQLSASVIENMITDTKAMVAAMPPGNTAFDDTHVNNNSPGTGYDFLAVEKEFKSKLGMR